MHFFILNCTHGNTPGCPLHATHALCAKYHQGNRAHCCHHICTQQQHATHDYLNTPALTLVDTIPHTTHGGVTNEGPTTDRGYHHHKGTTSQVVDQCSHTLNTLQRYHTLSLALSKPQTTTTAITVMRSWGGSQSATHRGTPQMKAAWGRAEAAAVHTCGVDAWHTSPQ